MYETIGIDEINCFLIVFLMSLESVYVYVPHIIACIIKYLEERVSDYRLRHLKNVLIQIR